MKVLLIEKEAVIHVAIASLTKKLLLDEAERVEVQCEIRMSCAIYFFIVS